MKTALALIIGALLLTVGTLAYLGIIPFTTSDREEPQTATVSFPTGGESLAAGGTYTLRWHDPEQGPITQVFLIDTSLESTGASVAIVDRVYNIENTGSYTYSFPANLKAGTYVFAIGTLRSQTFDVVADTAGLETYTSHDLGFSLQYPSDFTRDENYTYDHLGPDATSKGVRFTIPATVATGTNLSQDTYIAVESLPHTACSAAPFVPAGIATSSITDAGHNYSFATSSDAGAGNRYEELVYALSNTSPCLAVRYFIHSTVLENYPEGAVRQFDRQALIDQFDQIRRSLKVEQ